MAIIAKNIGKVIGAPPTRILKGISLEIQEGDFIALTGRSGSGKSSLLYILSTLDQATEGSLEIEGQNIHQMSQHELNHFRNETMGFVFQFHYLISELTTLENVLLPARKQKRESQQKAYAQYLLEKFDLKEKMQRLPRQLSGGEQQRIAIARALLLKPKYLFADEPTGSLDSINSEIVMNIIRESNESLKTTVVLVTHDRDYASRSKKIINLVDGEISSLGSL